MTTFENGHYLILKVFFFTFQHYLNTNPYYNQHFFWVVYISIICVILYVICFAVGLGEQILLFYYLQLNY